MSADWQPTPEDVKARIPTRVGGRPFSATSHPSVGVVEELIDEHTADLIDALNNEAIPENLEDTARRAVTYFVAAELERAFYPEQDDSAHDVLKARADALLDRLQRSILGGDPDNTDGGPFGSPTHSFPESVPLPSGEEYTPLGTLGF